MIIIPDTNIFFNDWALQRTMIRILLEFASKAGFQIIIPEIVVMELINQVREEIDSVANKNNKRLLDLHRKFGVSVSSVINGDEVHEEVKKYESFLRQRLKTSGAIIAKIPSIPHKEIIDRDLGRRKPFTKDGKGYRDALIWKTILDTVVSQKEELIFISENSTDFADDNKKGFHPDLIQDLGIHKIDPSKVILVLSLPLFIKENLIPRLSSPEQTLVNFLQKTHPTFNMENELADTLSEELLGTEVDCQFGNRPEYESPTFSMVEEVHDVDILDEHVLSSTERIIELEASLYCEFDAFIFKSELWCMNEDEMPYVSDPDWNKHYAAVSFSQTIQARLYITLDMEKGEISSVEVVEISGVHSDD